MRVLFTQKSLKDGANNSNSSQWNSNYPVTIKGCNCRNHYNGKPQKNSSVHFSFFDMIASFGSIYPRILFIFSHAHNSFREIMLNLFIFLECFWGWYWARKEAGNAN